MPKIIDAIEWQEKGRFWAQEAHAHLSASQEELAEHGLAYPHACAVLAAACAMLATNYLEMS